MNLILLAKIQSNCVMDIVETDAGLHIFGKLTGDFSVTPDGSKILYFTTTKNGNYQYIDVLIYDVQTKTTTTIKEIETLCCYMCYGAHHWTYFHKIHNMWVVDVQFNPFLYPNTDDNIVPKAHGSTMIRIHLETGTFERLPAPFPRKI